ncbi:MAG: hypothetical protein MJ208_00905 [Bacilli bacterium]|nr:hypothetical protein [Bacilli bacterium]
MKKEDVISLLVYILMIVIAVMVGLYVIRPLFEHFTTGGDSSAVGNMGWALLLVLGAIIFNVAIIELGHMLGAKLSGYKFFSVNMLGLCFYKKGEKWKVKFANFDGLTGETKIAPVKEKASPRLFSLMPLFFYLIETIALMITFNVLNNLIGGDWVPASHRVMLLICILCIIFVTVGGMLTLYNIFPAKLDTTTDGYRLTLLSKPENAAAFNELMRIECAYAEGKELTDMKVFNEINDFTSSINLYTVYRYLGEKNYDAASPILDHIIQEKAKISRETYCSAVAQKMFIVLLNQDLNTAKAYYDAHIDQAERRYISNDISMPSIRAYMLISSMLDISEHEARFAKSRVKKALKRTPPGRVKVEEELYQIAINKVDQVRPEWHIKDTEVK